METLVGSFVSEFLGNYMFLNFIETILWKRSMKYFDGIIGYYLRRAVAIMIWFHAMERKHPTAPQAIQGRGDAKALLEASKVIDSMRRRWLDAQCPSQWEERIHA